MDLRIVVLAVAVGAMAARADWPQWRGPERTGLSAASPALGGDWQGKGPPLVWESEPVPSGDAGGYASPVVAGGRVFLYVAWRYEVPLEKRTLAGKDFEKLGVHAADVPADLAAKVEAARISADRAKLKGGEVRDWVAQWLAANIAEAQKTWSTWASDRLTRGAEAMPTATLAKLAAIKDKPMAPAEFEQYVAALGLSPKQMDAVVRLAPAATPHAKDVILCLDAQTGKTLWKTEYPGAAHGGRGTACTPTVWEEKVYASGWKGTVYCLDAKTGKEIWKSEGGKGTNSSLAVVDGKVINVMGPLTALDAKTGAKLWEQKNAAGGHGSPAVWRSGGKTYLLCNGKEVTCLDAEDGKVAWKAPGGGDSTPVAAGTSLAVLTGARGGEGGLLVYRISPQKAELVARVDLSARGATPAHDGQRVFAVGDGDTVCVEASSGKVQWQLGGAKETWSSPMLADGKLVAALGRSVWIIEPGPTEAKVLAKGPIDIAQCTSGAISEGRLYVRGAKSVLCYDLRKQRP